tara:strand:+ start:436 stop:588 length:153 start_codon:yes stop_codon:yes gene_type:complete
MNFICYICNKQSIWITNTKLHIEGKAVCDNCFAEEFSEPEIIIKTINKGV